MKKVPNIRHKTMESNESFKALYTISFLLPTEFENCEKHIETILCITLDSDFLKNIPKKI